MAAPTLYYNPPNETGLVGLMQYNNQVTGNAFGGLILIVIFAMMFMGFKSRPNNSTGESLAGAMFITTVSNVFLFILSVTTDYTLVVTSALTIISAVMLHRQGN